MNLLEDITPTELTVIVFGVIGLIIGLLLVWSPAFN